MSRTQASEPQQAVFAALADPLRRNVVLYLAQNSPRTATQLAKKYPITRQGMRKHLTVLHDAGLVAVQQRGREMRYTLTPQPLDELEQWLGQIEAVWDERLLRLKSMVEDDDGQD